MKCPYCDKDMKKRLTAPEFNYKKHKFSVSDFPVFECECCKETFINEKLMQPAIDKIRAEQKRIDDL